MSALSQEEIIKLWNQLEEIKKSIHELLGDQELPLDSPEYRSRFKEHEGQLLDIQKTIDAAIQHNETAQDVTTNPSKVDGAESTEKAKRCCTYAGCLDRPERRGRAPCSDAINDMLNTIDLELMSFVDWTLVYRGEPDRATDRDEYLARAKVIYDHLCDMKTLGKIWWERALKIVDEAAEKCVENGDSDSCGEYRDDVCGN